jgi:hypothetical protein
MTAGIAAAMVPADYRQPAVIRAIQAELDCSEEAAQKLFGDLVVFLCVSGQSSEATIPTPAIDVAWHAFLQLEPEYKAFCDAYCGGYIDHEQNPDSTALVSVDAVRPTIDNVTSFLGHKPSVNWDYVPLKEWAQAA